MLPLFVGRDLDESTTHSVAAHLSVCSECSLSENEYRELMMMIGQFSPPAFSDSMFAGIRQRVQRDIENAGNAPTLTQILADYFRPRFGWYVAAALLVTIAGSAVFFTTVRNQNRPLIADNGTAQSIAPHIGQSIESQSPEAFPDAARPVDPPQGKVVKTTAGRAYRSHRGVRSVTAIAGNQLAVKTESKTTLAIPAATNVAHISAAAAVESPLKMEMQTKDPNVRIIWFAHPVTKQNSRN